MIDFGIVSVLLIQLAMCLGCLFAFTRIQHAMEGLNAYHQAIENLKLSHKAVEVKVAEAMDYAKNIDGEKFTALKKSLAAMEDDRAKLVRLINTMEDTLEKQGTKLISLTAKLAAQKRWEKEEQAEGKSSNDKPTDPNQVDLMGDALGGKYANFGKKFG